VTIERSNTPVTRIGPTVAPRLFTEKGTAVAMAIGGPLAGAYLISKNFLTLGKKQAARWTLIIGGGLTVALFTTFALLPSRVADKIPQHFIPLAYGVLGYFIVKSLQQRDIEAHLQAGGKKGSWQVIVGSGFIALVLSLGYVYALVMLVPLPQQIFDGVPYKFEGTGETIYYDKATITEPDIRFVGKELEKVGYFSADNPIPAGFRKEGDRYTVEILLDQEKWNATDIQLDIQLFLRTLKNWHQDRKFQVRVISIDSIGERKSKVFQNSE
jgi:hypothetical protein